MHQDHPPTVGVGCLRLRVRSQDACRGLIGEPRPVRRRIGIGILGWATAFAARAAANRRATKALAEPCLRWRVRSLRQ